jgi:hypothetical protein
MTIAVVVGLVMVLIGVLMVAGSTAVGARGEFEDFEELAETRDVPFLNLKTKPAPWSSADLAGLRDDTDVYGDKLFGSLAGVDSPVRPARSFGLNRSRTAWTAMEGGVDRDWVAEPARRSDSRGSARPWPLNGGADEINDFSARSELAALAADTAPPARGHGTAPDVAQAEEPTEQRARRRDIAGAEEPTEPGGQRVSDRFTPRANGNAETLRRGAAELSPISWSRPSGGMRPKSSAERQPIAWRRPSR